MPPLAYLQSRNQYAPVRNGSTIAFIGLAVKAGQAQQSHLVKRRFEIGLTRSRIDPRGLAIGETCGARDCLPLPRRKPAASRRSAAKMMLGEA